MQRSLDWVRMEASRCLTVPRLLLIVAVFFIPLPSWAQWGGGDGACAARAAGKDDRQASRAAANAMANSMTGSFSSNIATIITGGRAMRDSIQYLIRQQCPDLLNGSASQSPPPARPTNPSEINQWCSDNPWLKECGGQNAEKIQSVYGIDAIPSQKLPDPVSAETKANQICLKAADYAGCMKYQMSKQK